MRLERRPRRRHQRRGPHAGRREVGRRRARVARRPAVLVEVLGAAHGVPPLDAALRHAVLALELGGAPRARLAAPHARPLGLGPRPLRAAVEALGAQHARAAAGGPRQRLGALGGARVGLVALALVGRVAGVGVGGVGGRRLAAARARAVLLLGVVGVVAAAARPGALGLVAGGGGVAQVAREPGRLELVRARAGRGAGAARGAQRALGRGAAARLGLLVVVVALVRVRDAAVVERRGVVQRPQLLVERAGQRRHEVAGPCKRAGGLVRVEAGVGHEYTEAC